MASTRTMAKNSEAAHRHTLPAPSLGGLKSIRKVRRAAPEHVGRRRFDAAKTCKIQCADKPLRPKGASERQFALSRRHSLAAVTVRILHILRIFCSRSILGSLVLLLHWRIVDGAAPFLGKGQQPVLVEPRCYLVRWPSRRRGIMPPTRHFDGVLLAVDASSAEPGRSAQA
jgi:hypothetical protein